MVRETRHLWVGNLPENIREDRIREHFKRYGRVQSVKLLPRGEECPVDGGSSSSLSEGNEGGSGASSGSGGGSGGGGSSTNGGASATVAFMDIKSAAKAHAIEHTLDERALTTQYYEPQLLQHRFPSHTSEDHGSGSGGGNNGAGGVSGGSGSGSGTTGAGVGGSSGGSERGDRGSEGFDTRGSHGSFYGSERSNRVVGTGGISGVGSGGGSGSGVNVGGHAADPSTGDPGGYISRNRPPPASSYHVTSSRARDRLYPRSGPYVSGPPPPPHIDRHRASLPPSSWSTYEPTSSRYSGALPPPSPATNDAYQDEQGGGGGGSGSGGALRQHKKQRRKSRSGSSSPSGSSRSGSSSSSRSGSSGGSTSGRSTSPGSSPHRTSNAAVTEDRRPLAICVRNLPTRSSDTSLKDGLFHEYKKHGKVTWVKVVGAAGDRYALVCFKKPEDVEKALEVSQDKLFFGCKIEVAPYQGYDVEDNEFRPYEAELDEYHPKATRTLFIGNLEKDVTASELRKHFESFGEIIEIDIKKQGAVSSYAFCQYSDIGSVVKAMRSMDGEHLGANRIKLGFGKSMPTSCVWVDGIGDCMSEKYLNMQFHQFGPITQIMVDRERGHALVFFDQISCAQAAVKEMRGVALRGRRLQVDFASRECQETFYEHLERQGNSNEKPWDSRPSPASSFDVTRERSNFDSAVTVSNSSSRFTRYDTPPRSRTASYSRTSGGSTPGASPAHPTAMSRSSRRSYQDSYYDGDYSESRRFRNYDEYSQGSGASHDDYQSSVLSDGKLNDDDCPPPSRRHAMQSVVTSVDPPAPPPPLLPPPDIRHLQKERVHLLEQLEECHSSGDEMGGFLPKKRTKHDNTSSTILCEDDEPEIASLLVTSHSNRKGMDFRRVSDNKVVVHHGTRRGSCEGRGPGPCKRRRDVTSRHHEHHDGSRPGTPLVDERPENLVPSEPRRFRERSHEGPLSLPLPRFAAQMLNNNNNNNNNTSNNNNGNNARSNSASLAKIASPPCTSLSTAPSPRAAPQPPASPPRHTSTSPTSSDSETAPQSPSLEERIRSLDEKYEKWSGSRALSAAGGDALAKLDASASERFRFRHKLLDLDLHEVQPSDIVKSVLAKRSVFDEDSKRLENFNEKYEPREFTGVIGVNSVIGSTAGLTVSSGCTSKVCLQYPFPSHPPVQSTSSTSVTNQVGINTPLSASLPPTTNMVISSKNDPRIMVQHNCIHPTPATPITPGTSIKTVSPELPPVSLPIGLCSGTAVSSGNGGLASTNSLLSNNGSVGSIHNLGASTHRGLNISATIASSMVTATDAFSTAVTTAVPVMTLIATSATTTVSVTNGALTSMTTTSSIAPSSSITPSSNSSCLLSLSASSTDIPRSRLRKEISSGSSRESRDSRDIKDSKESKHSKGKDCQRRSRKDEADVEKNRKDKDERESSNIANDIGNTDNHKDFKDNKELRYERKEREEKERRDKEDRDKQDRRDKEDRDRQEKKERDERERREKDEERREKERLEKERQEKDRKEREERERERKEREENELKEKERREKERIDRERREREEKERQERREREERERREREERERKEREIRLEREKQEKERLRKEREEQERREKEERERKREEKERLERERKREREEKERLERERRKEEREKIEKEKREKEERERLEREKRREREDQERREKEKAEREKRRDREEKDKEKRERDDNRRQSIENHLHSSITQSQNQVIATSVPIKRRCSSQDGPDEDVSKRVKISDHRRDSKDRSRQNRRSEDRKHRNDSHRSSRENRENRDSKENSNATQDSRDGAHSESTRETNSRDNGKEKQRSKRNRAEKESRERSPRVLHESDKEFLSRLELSKKSDSSSLSEQASIASNHARDMQHHQQQQQSTLNSHSDVDDGLLSTHDIQVTRNPSATDTDSDEPKKHSIFDIVDDEPAYISMYDKVKARSTKNMQKLEEEKRQVRLKDKFSQLKQSRARREEKKQSTSWDGDSVSSKALTEDEATSESDSTRTKSLSRKGSRSRIHSDTSEEEEPFNNKIRKPAKAERFIESDVDLGFVDTEEKQDALQASNVIVNSVHTNIKEEARTSDEDERISIDFRANPVVNNHDRDPRKKNKKKQKRQKNNISSEDTIKVEPTEASEHKNKTNIITSSIECRPNHSTDSTVVVAATTIAATIPLENSDDRMRADKKQRSKKDKRRDRNGEDKAKARRKRLNRQEARDSQRMEDIFGPLSDDVDDGPSTTFFNRFGNMTSENSAYASDSDGGRSSLDMDRVRRKTEKKRRHQPEDENSVDLAEAGREIEAKLLDMPNSPKAAPASTEPSDHDVFRFTDDNDSIEPSTPSAMPEKIKEKKKKRKKSKEERSRKDYHHHHHHHHHHHEKTGELPYLGAEPSPPRASSPLVSKTISPNLSTSRETLLSPISKVTSNVSTVSSITPSVVSGNIQASKPEKKKDKFIPGFGIEIDETIHENAVKSISEPDERGSSCQSRNSRAESEVSVPTTPPAQNEDKPRVAISQEETEDAVAALLEETFGASTEDFSYEGEEEEDGETDGIAEAPTETPQEDVEEMQQAVDSLNASTGEGDADLKPDTPQSEHDLQIDTDTEEDPNYETVDLTQPPKTPDIPSFYKSPAKTLNATPVLTVPEKSVEVRLSTTVTKPQSPPSSVIAHSWNLNEHKPRESVKQPEIAESDTDVTNPERIAQTQKGSASPSSPQYKQPVLVPCSVPIEVPKTLTVSNTRPSSITPLYQRLPVSPQTQMVPMRQASPKIQNATTVSCSSSSNTSPLPPLIPSRIPPLVPSQQLSPRVSQPLSPNGQWSRSPVMSPHVPNVGKRKASPPSPTKIAVCVPIPAHRPEAPIQQIYSTAATQQPVIQHASGMLAPASSYPRGGLPPLTLNIPPRPYMPVPPLASGIQVKNSRDSSLGCKSVIETLLSVNPNEPPQRLEEPKLSPAVIPEPTNKASTSPKVPSPNQPPTYIPETAKIEINASTSNQVFSKPAYITDSYALSSRTQKHISVSITTDNNLLSPRQKQDASNLQLLTTHVRSSTPNPVIVAHCQSHLIHKSVHTLGSPIVSSSNQSLIKTVVPVIPQQIIPSTASPIPSENKCIISQTSLTCQRHSPVSQNQLIKSHVPVSTVSQTIITRVVPSTVSSMSTSPMNEQITSDVIQEQQVELDAEVQIGNQIAQPMQFIQSPIQPTQPIDEIKQESTDVKQEGTMDETKYNIVESEKLLNQSCIEDNIKLKQEKEEIVKAEIAPCIPKVETTDTVVPKLEAERETPIKLEPVNEIKEEDVAKDANEMELDEEPMEDPLKEPSTDPLAIDSKEDPTDNKEDSDYWSAKEVNIESVIKKVDALCDGEGNDGDDEVQQAESDSHDTNKNEDWFDESIENESKKNFVSTDEHDESIETCENESTRSRRGRTKSRRGGRGGVTTRRGRNANTVSNRRGGRSLRGSKHHVEKNKPADVYEFHDDSEEDRPRLILTIKSSGPNVTGSNVQPVTPVAAVKEIPPEEFVAPAANTRKSKRLAERDGSRNTVDDVIEDVVRGSPTNKGLVGSGTGNIHATRRSTRHNNVPRNTTQQSTVPLTELRKSPRGNRKATRRTSENNDDSGEEKTKETTTMPQEITNKEEPKVTQPESPKAEESAQTVTPTPQKTVSLEPMTLIDPVTGMLIPMRESEEGQYIPVSTSSGQAQTTNRILCESRSGGLINANPTSSNEAPCAKPVPENSLLVTAELKKEPIIEHTSSQPAPTQQIQPQTSVITKPQSPAMQVTSTVTVAQSSTTGTTITVTTTNTPIIATAQAVPTSFSQTKPTSLKAHVLNASKLVTSAQQQVVITKSVASNLPNQTIVQNIIKSPVQAIQGGLNLQIPSGRVMSPSLSPRAKQTAQLVPSNGKQGQPMSPVLNNTGVPPNPKQHLLQAATKQQTSMIVNMSQKIPMNAHSGSVSATSTPRIHQPVSQPTALKGINGQPHPLNPKTHLLQAVVPPIVTGAVASSPTQPHLVNPQPISTGVSNIRPPGPKTPTGTMEPQKVEVSMSGCIMVPTASPQTRVPMPTYEAPLHGSTSATPSSGQYSLVPSHRSQSPPLPPPAHHHINTSQNEVVNHYGGLTRSGELPPHYLHPQMLQYQYLRAQQEALTAPRIAYHIPGTRSPHLSLDPKLETGIEDSHSPPLELRRGTRTPQDRTTDSPQIAQVYMLHGGVRLPPPPPQYNAGSPSLAGTPTGTRTNYYEPPPAHLRSQYPIVASEAPSDMGRATTPERCRKHQVVTPPPYASQVPPQADTFQMLLQRYPVMWQGLLALKNDQAAVQMHFVFGNPNVARESLPCNSDGSTPPLRIAQRMRLEQTQVEGVARKMQTDNEHCMLLALPCGRDEVDVLQQSKNLQTGFIMYLQQKQAAGIVNIAAPGSQQPAYVVHIFPSCDFAHENLARIAPDLLHRVAKIAHLLIVIATV